MPLQDPSRPRTPQLPSRPTTPLRPSSRTSLRASQTTPGSGHKPYSLHSSSAEHDDPLLALEPAFAELSDSMADLEANFIHLQLLNESLGRFNENFAAFLYGMNMTAFCVDFPEAPIPQSFARRHEDRYQSGDRRGSEYAISASSGYHDLNKNGGPRAGHVSTAAAEIDATFLTSDTSFVDHPPPTVSSKGHKYSASVPAARTTNTTSETTPKKRGGVAGRGVGRGEIARSTSTRQPGFGARGTNSSSTSTARGGRAGGIPRGVSSRGTRGSSGIARGTFRGTTK